MSVMAMTVRDGRNGAAKTDIALIQKRALRASPGGKIMMVIDRVTYAHADRFMLR